MLPLEPEDALEEGEEEDVEADPLPAPAAPAAPSAAESAEPPAPISSADSDLTDHAVE